MDTTTQDITAPTRDEKLWQVRRVVAEAKDDQLVMGCWEVEITGCAGGLARLRDQGMTCGTARCVGGSAAADRWFRSRHILDAAFDVVDVAEDRVNVRPRHYSSDQTFLELALAFEVGQADACHLFGWGLAHDAVLPKSVILDNVDRLLRGEASQPYPGADRFSPEEFWPRPKLVEYQQND